MLEYTSISKALKGKGFPFIKIELEAEIDYSGESVEFECTSCSGTGRIPNPLDRRRRSECWHCAGGGRIFAEIDDCESFGAYVKSQLPEELKSKITNWWVYNDGSVNTEISVTVSVEALPLLEGMIKLFGECAKNCGRVDTRNAGMHITLLAQGNQPVADHLDRLPVTKIRNFRYEMEKFVDSMYILASGDGKQTRGMHFRGSMVSADTKYSAIYTHGDRCIEYRIFDPCYYNAERLSIYLNTIVKTLKFYSEVRRFESFEYSQNKVADWRNGMRDLYDVYQGKSTVKRMLQELVYIHPVPKKVEYLSKRFDLGYVNEKFIIKELAKGF